MLRDTLSDAKVYRELEYTLELYEHLRHTERNLGGKGLLDTLRRKRRTGMLSDHDVFRP